MMQAIAYYLALPFLYLISVLPDVLFYGLSDCIRILLYNLIGYRKQIVRQNLRRSFPEKSESELLTIEKKFFTHLIDLFLETFRTLTKPKSFFRQRVEFSERSKSLFDEFALKKQSILIVMGHYGNWEWAGNSFSLNCAHNLFVVYHPVSNKYFNQLIFKMRTRFGTRLIEMKKTFREMTRFRNELNATAFIADQTPSPNNAYWTIFLNQPTPVFFGTEVIARKMDLPVVYASVKKIRRGYYRIEAETLVINSSQTIEGEITEAHTRRLERDIILQPEDWLWSHRRWKHKPPASNH